jgi:hypothetical protein
VRPTAHKALFLPPPSFRPKGGTSFRPKGETPSRPRTTVISTRSGETPFRPKGGTSFRPKGGTSFRPKGGTSFRPKGGTSFRPRTTVISTAHHRHFDRREKPPPSFRPKGENPQHCPSPTSAPNNWHRQVYRLGLTSLPYFIMEIRTDSTWAVLSTYNRAPYGQHLGCPRN